MRVLPFYSLPLAILLSAPGRALRGPQDTDSGVFSIYGEISADFSREKRDSSENSVAQSIQRDDSNITTVFDLKDSHLHLMVHWAGRGSSIMFCLARDQGLDINSTSRFFKSSDYGSTFKDISNQFLLESGENATINKFFYHPNNHCYYVFTDVVHKRIFVSLDCAVTVVGHNVSFTPHHVEFDLSTETRFLIHERGNSNFALYVTENYGETFTTVGSYIKNFYIHYSETGTVMYAARLEPTRSLTILSSTDFFKESKNTRVVFTGAEEFELKENLLFAVRNDSKNPDEKLLYVGKHDEKMTIAKFPEKGLSFLSYYVVDVTEEGSIMVIASHNATYSNLYISDVVSQHQVEFSLSLERIMFYAPRSTWRNSWIASLLESMPDSEATFADFYKISGLRGVYLASQLAPGVSEESIKPNNLTTVITFDAGAVWSPVEGPTTDYMGHPILGCYKDANCSLHIAQQMSKKYPATRSIPILTSAAAPGVVLATGNMGKNLQTKTNVFLSADAGLSWHQVLQGNYYYNIGDHGGVIVAVKYFKTEGYTNQLLYSTDEGLNWRTHQFYPTPMRIFGLITEPGENTTIFTMFGTKGNPGQPIDWVMIKVDLSSVFKRNCSEEDYKEWSPKAPEEGKLSKCVMGRRDVFERRSPRADCYNGRDYTRSKRVEICPCTHFDYRCDFGYVRADSARSGGCVKNLDYEDLEVGAIPAVCPPNTFYNLTKGYVRVAGDSCQGGLSSRYEPETRACPYDISGRETFLLVAQRKTVGRLSLDQPNATLVSLPLVGVTNVIAMDMDYENGCVFWADMDLDTISKQCLSNSSKVEVLVNSSLKSVEGMAFDHISKILYYVDGFRKTVELVKTDTSSNDHPMRKIILTSSQLGHTSKPRGIAVHPKQGYLFYTDWAEKAACVGRSLLDGTNHTIIVNSINHRNQVQMKWPNGITVDSLAERVYWVDAQLDYIASVTLDGEDFKKVVFGRLEVAHPFAVWVFKEEIYWDDWTRKSIFSVNKNNGTKIRVVKADLVGAMDLKVYSPHLLTERNACSAHTCSHLCIALPPGSTPPYRCLCPDGMKAAGSGSETKCVCPDNQELFTNGTCSAAQVGGKCDSELQFQCSNKLCVPQLWKCDGINDCGDLSDESDCLQDTCPDNKFQCPDKKCIPKHWKCDNEKDCSDGSDESDCPRQECDTKVQFECANGQCINMKWRCDMDRDCYDGSDELGCTNSTKSCKDDHMQCPDGSCLPASWRCDGDEDCPGGWDELNCNETSPCQDWQFRCDNFHCIYSTWQCDGQPDCSDGSDERGCADNGGNSTHPLPAPVPNFPQGDCNEWMFKCESEQCIPFWWKCDGVPDCSDESDEKGCGHPIAPGNSSGVEPPVAGCADNKFQCHDGKCIFSAWLCDGESDCHEGEDEDAEMCRDKVRCIPGQFLCTNAPGCVSMNAVCNGRADCADGSDEEGCGPVGPDSLPLQCTEDEEFSCDMGTLCLTWNHKCDGHFDCRDGSDEEECLHWIDDVAITQLEVSEPASEDSAEIRWSVKADLVNSSTSLKYKVSYTVCDHDHWVNQTADWVVREAWEDRLDHLNPGTEYRVRLYAVNADTGKEFHHAPVARFNTTDGVPTAPRNLTVRQQGTAAVLSWKPPLDPRGTLQYYKVVVTDNAGNVFNTADIRVKDNLASGVAGFGGLRPGGEFTFQVFAWNRVHQSPGSESLKFRVQPEVESINILEINETMIRISWPELAGVGSFYVKYQSANQLDQGTDVNVTKNKADLTGLVPGTDYTISVSGILDSGLTLARIVKVRTGGLSLPAPVLLADGTGLTDGSPTSVKLAWSVPDTEAAEAKKFTFAVWYGASLRELFSAGPRATFSQELHGTLPGLAACTDYIFTVAIMLSNNTSGMGTMADPKTVSTLYSETAAPKRVRVIDGKLTWDAPCDKLSTPVKYLVKLTDTITGQLLITTLGGTKNTTISYAPRLVSGGVYSATVEQVAKQAAVPSPPIKLYGPAIPPPTAVYADFANRSLSVHWGRPNLTGEFSFEVLVSPATDTQEGSPTSPCAYRMPTRQSPLVVNTSDILHAFDKEEKCSSTEFQVAVSTVITRANSVVYRSAWVRAPKYFVDMEQHTGEIVLEESSAVGTVVGVLFFIAILASALAYFVHKNRRLKRNFQEFAASHYNSASGAAILIEDDDESPIIRGFSDSEPLVVT